MRRENPLTEWVLARWVWLAAIAALLAGSMLFISATGMRPAYDAYGWLVWGRQAAHLHLDTNAAPSWKPLAFLFTFPYALLAGRAALWLWMVTAVAGALAGSLFAGRIAYRLCGPNDGHRYARVAGAVFAAVGVLGIEGYWHFVLIATSDPLMTTLCLAAIDAHLSGHRRLAWVLIVLTSLGRPEAWLVTAVYAAWLWRTEPSLRRAVGVGLVAIPALWFGIPAITSDSPFIAGKVEADSTVAVPGNRILGMLNGFTHLYELPMQLAGTLAVAYALFRRERIWLAVIGMSLLWLLTEAAFALHGWAPSPRYMFEPEAVLVVLVGATIGRVLRLPRLRLSLVRWAAIAGVAALVVTLAPHARTRARLAHNGIELGRTWSRQIHRLDTVIAAEGGPKRILACGQPVTVVSFQTILAWAVDRNVADIGWDPPRWIKAGQPIVLFQPQWAGWEVLPLNVSPPKRAACERLRTNTDFG
jgi:hypothetical protein